jgi:hypothetical protein
VYRTTSGTLSTSLERGLKLMDNSRSFDHTTRRREQLDKGNLLLASESVSTIIVMTIDGIVCNQRSTSMNIGDPYACQSTKACPISPNVRSTKYNMSSIAPYRMDTLCSGSTRRLNNP